jgi:hypothetical protein
MGHQYRFVVEIASDGGRNACNGNVELLPQVPDQIRCESRNQSGVRRIPLGARGNFRMSRAGQYRRYAAECLRLATSSDDVREKAVLLQMAEQWRELAERAETKDRES